MRGALLGLCLLALLTSGCLPWFDRTEQRLNEIAYETHAQGNQQDALVAEVADIRAMLESEGLSTDEKRAELLTRLRSLERAVERLAARGEEQEVLLRRMGAAIDQLARQAGLAPSGGGLDAPQPDSLVAAAEPDSIESELPVEAPPELVIYDAAMGDFRRGRYILARTGFEELIHAHPNSQLADNATYWLGESLYAEADFTAALVRYEEVMELYPLSDVLPAATLKSAYCHLELGDRAAAVGSFRAVIRDFPDTDESTNAAHRLASMGVDQ